MFAQRNSALAHDAAEFSAFAHAFQQFDSAVTVAPFDHAAIHADSDQVTGFDGVDTHFIAETVETGSYIEIPNQAVGAEQGNGFIFQTRGDMIALWVIVDIGASALRSQDGRGRYMAAADFILSFPGFRAKMLSLFRSDSTAAEVLDRDSTGGSGWYQ